MKTQRNNAKRKSIAIIGEGLTEYRYIDSMKSTERYRFRLVPGFPKHTVITDLVELARKRKDEGYDYVLCLVDMDIIQGNHNRLMQYKKLKKENADIIFVESSPCTEYWFLLHFMPSPSSRDYQDYDTVAKELRKNIPNYDKTEEVFNKTNIYTCLKEKGNMERALNISRELDILRSKEPDVYKSYSQMYKLFDIIREIVIKD